MRALALVLLGALGPLPGLAQELAPDEPGSTLTLEEYVATLDVVRADLEAGRLDAARSAAGTLVAKQVSWSGGTFGTDATVLADVTQVTSGAAARAQGARLRRLLAALDDTESPGSAVDSDPAVLARVTPRSEIMKGGEAPSVRVEPLSFPQWIGRTLVAMGDWIADTYRKITDWLERLWPSRTRVSAGDTGTTALVAIAFAAVVAAFLVVLAVRSLRRGQAPPTDGVSFLVRSSSRDEDPFSREASEWEVYARELAAQRRWREAIRAWYHAVLVALFQSGLLHHQTGRTNWEYVSQLSPQLAWRPGFVSLTRRFDREWYGRPRSDGAAFADCAREAQGLLRAVRERGVTS